jgi:hypothetical protein
MIFLFAKYPQHKKKLKKNKKKFNLRNMAKSEHSILINLFVYLRVSFFASIYIISIYL